MQLRKKTKVTIPYEFEPRDYQLPLMRAMDEGYKRLVAVWHRRAGKDKTMINIVAKEMMKRVGTYYYFFPTYQQGRKVLWQGMDSKGFKFIDHIPKELRKKQPNDTEMKIELKNGSVFQVIGTDKIDSNVGANPIGVIFSEYSLQDPSAWNMMRPILAENGGWALFNYTARGENHGYTLYKFAKSDSKWFCQKLSVEDTGAISKEVLEQERKEILAQNAGDDALFWQEYYNDFKVPIQGSYYGKILQKMEQEGRIGKVPYEPNLPVNTYWDLGINDSMTIWFIQFLGKERRVIDFYENSGEGLIHYIKVLKDKKYIYGEHYAPHDIKVRELSTGKSRLETASSLGLDFNVIPKLGVQDGIDAVRNILHKCWFDAEKTEQGLNALKSYHKEYDEKNKVYRKNPKHDWASHPADAFRGFAVAENDMTDYYVPSPDLVNSSVITY